MEVSRSNPAVGVGLSFASLALLFSVMLLGVYITSSGHGLSCPDWPLCPNGFGWPTEEYLFEHVHRMMVVITGSFIYATAGYAAKRLNPARKTAFLAAAIVSIQIALGMVVVESRLFPIIVAAHLATGITLFAMTLMTFLTAYRLATGRGV